MIVGGQRNGGTGMTDSLMAAQVLIIESLHFVCGIIPGETLPHRTVIIYQHGSAGKDIVGSAAGVEAPQLAEVAPGSIVGNLRLAALHTN